MHVYRLKVSHSEKEPGKEVKVEVVEVVTVETAQGRHIDTVQQIQDVHTCNQLAECEKDNEGFWRTTALGLLEAADSLLNVNRLGNHSPHSLSRRLPADLRQADFRMMDCGCWQNRYQKERRCCVLVLLWKRKKRKTVASELTCS